MRGFSGGEAEILAARASSSLISEQQMRRNLRLRSAAHALGRDANFMSMLGAALDQANAHPHASCWAAPYLTNVDKPVQDLIALARTKGVSAYLVEAGTFDTMLMRLWRQKPHKPGDLEVKIYTAKAQSAAIPLRSGFLRSKSYHRCSPSGRTLQASSLRQLFFVSRALAITKTLAN